jgi:predicted lipoprotein with Yx(FWY)xxD motif
VKNGTTAVLVLGLGAVLAACGRGGSTVSSSTKTSKPASSSAKATSGTVNVVNSKLGRILVDANGRTLYAFDHDTPTMSACTTANGCAGLWPPLTVTGQPTGGTGVTATMLTVLTGGTQVVYGGHPLYTFAMDTAPGDLKGQGFAGNIWHVVSPAGQTITGAVPANAPATTGSGSGSGGYGY